MTLYEVRQAKVLSTESWEYLITRFVVESGRCKGVIALALTMRKEKENCFERMESDA